MTNAYKATKVPVSRSQEAIRKLLIAFGARSVQFGEDFESGTISVRFAKKLDENSTRTVSVTMQVPEPAPAKRQRTRQGTYRNGRIIYSKTLSQKKEQMVMSTFRALHDWLKAQFVAVEFGLLSFEDVFLSHFEWISADGEVSTIGNMMKPKLLMGNLLSSIETGYLDADVVDIK